MAEGPSNRRLAAILAADVVGYSRLMGADEAGTLSRLKDHRAMVFDPAVAQYRGRVVKLMGDGALVEFPSVVDALNCALEIQRTIASEMTGGSQITLRIGINLGDIVVDGDDIYGDGVNIAARLEPIAEPGGIAISAVVRDSVGNRVDASFEDGGEIELKNIERPVRVWKWRPDGGAAVSHAAASLGRLLLPSVAVLPFQNMSGDSEQEYFADGIVEDIITALSRFKSFAVIARNSSFVYKGRAVDIRQAAKELGVRYVLEGSVRRAGQRLRVTAQFVDGATGAHLWARNFDGAVEDVFDVQDRITESVVGVVEPHIRQAEIERSRRKRPESLDAYDLALRAQAKMYAGRAEDNAEAYALMQRAMALEPDYAPFIAGTLWALEARHAQGWPMLTADDRATALGLARRALGDAQGDATVLAQCAMTLLRFGGEYERGMQLFANAVEINPNNQTVLALAASAELLCGDLERSIELARRSMAFLSPSDPAIALPMTAIAHAHIVLGNYEEALRTAERSLAANPALTFTYHMLIAGNAKLGRIEEARRWLADYRRNAPGVTIARIKAGEIARYPERLEPMLEGLRAAGLEEE